jgi:hypothetical protein
MWIEINVNKSFKTQVSIKDVLDELNATFLTQFEKSDEAMRLLRSCLVCLKEMPDSIVELLTTADRNIISKGLIYQADRYAGRRVYAHQTVSCSQCGGDFGPGDHGFSHCENHAHLTRIHQK